MHRVLFVLAAIAAAGATTIMLIASQLDVPAGSTWQWNAPDGSKRSTPVQEEHLQKLLETLSRMDSRSGSVAPGDPSAVVRQELNDMRKAKAESDEQKRRYNIASLSLWLGAIVCLMIGIAKRPKPPKSPAGESAA